MFSGIVETIGTIQSLQSSSDAVVFHIQPQLPFNDIHTGDSISVNGVCLTVTEFTDSLFSVTAVPQTLRLTNLGDLQLNSQVNLERALLVGGRNGGHNVQGHVEGVATVVDIQEDGKAAWLVKCAIPQSLSKYIVDKGYITFDGMSITVIESGTDWFSVTLIPHTRAVTIASTYQVGSRINIEVDILGKYIEKMVAPYLRG